MTEVDETLASTLDCLDSAVNYMDWIVELIRPHLDGPILELGAGHGTFTAALARIGHVHAVEPGQHASSVLAERFAHDAQVTVVQAVVDDLPLGPTFGSAVMINVLEHIKDDAAALDAIRQRLRPDGAIAIWVPAFQMLFSRFDTKLGHFRRYRRPALQRLVEQSGYTVVDAKYVNLPGWFSWLVIARLLRREPTGGRLVYVFDRFVVPIVRWVETRIPPPFGQSILIIGRVREPRHTPPVFESTSGPT